MAATDDGGSAPRFSSFAGNRALVLSRYEVRRGLALRPCAGSLPVCAYVFRCDSRV
jgi:hypothetical protein